MNKNQTIRFIINASELNQLRLHKKDQPAHLISEAIHKLPSVKKAEIAAQPGEQ
ncbi:MAG TPA: hypothetical protein IGS52_08795 [Oscillatoriaceae cyanobacterium M33_DOE_052]|nr:hypothetical protein [Oscillatoriaceae cyanobacterium M33_DOE_052]